MRDAIISNAVFGPHGEAVEKISGVAVAWPRNDTIDVSVFIREVVAGVDVCHLIPPCLLSAQLRLASSATSFLTTPHR
jgi:hypothetical protein